VLKLAPAPRQSIKAAVRSHHRGRISLLDPEPNFYRRAVPVAQPQRTQSASGTLRLGTVQAVLPAVILARAGIIFFVSHRILLIELVQRHVGSTLFRRHGRGTWAWEVVAGATERRADSDPEGEGVYTLYLREGAFALAARARAGRAARGPGHGPGRQQSAGEACTMQLRVRGERLL
jgi:hypothetical protein